MENIYYLGLGSNMGDLKANLETAIEKINSITNSGVIKVSSFYSTKAWGYAEQADFLNAVIEVKTDYSPEEFLSFTQNIEKEMGRVKNFKYGPRVIDIDILFYGDKIINVPHLTIPHPEIENREFVLCPLNEIAPDFVHPVLKKSIKNIKRSNE